MSSVESSAEGAAACSSARLRRPETERESTNPAIRRMKRGHFLPILLFLKIWRIFIILTPFKFIKTFGVD